MTRTKRDEIGELSFYNARYAKESGVPTAGNNASYNDRLPRQSRNKILHGRAFLQALCLLLLPCWVGCSLLPDIRHKPQYINPFPQLRTLAVLPFANQSEDATLSGERVALAYINELQSIRGFEVLPLGAVTLKMSEFQQPLAREEDFQAFARFLGVDAVLIGSITDFDSYYPPRMSMKVNWYAANPGYHPMEVGYGLPWGTKGEKKIPKWIQYESQRALAAEQLKTQTPLPAAGGTTQTDPANLPTVQTALGRRASSDSPANGPVEMPSKLPAELELPPLMPEDREAYFAKQQSEVQTASATGVSIADQTSTVVLANDADWPVDTAPLPPDWPDPRGFLPDPPTATRPQFIPQSSPILSHMRNFNGHDEDFTEQLADYFYFRDDARFGGWQAYLQRSEDFIRFCCHLHLTETLASRGGQDKSRLIFRWPIDRYLR